MTRWVSLNGARPTTFAEWQAQQPPPSPLRLEHVYASEFEPINAISAQVVDVLVNPTIYADISASLAQWAADVESEGWGVVIHSASFPDPAALRDHLASVANIAGCLLVGDFPVPWYELGDSEFPFDVYYMDLNGDWYDHDLDGLYDEHVGDVAPEIWVGRLLASNLNFDGDEVSLLNNYFAKNHAYRTGSLPLPSRALVYIDDDWAYAAENMSQTMALLYPDTTVISDTNTTTPWDYSRRLTDYYAWIHVFAHSTAHEHVFTYDDGADRGAIHSHDIYEIDPHAFFYNLFACGAARFVERNYLSGWYVFADTYGLLSLGSTKSGSMVRGFDLFHNALAQGMPLGRAYWEWFVEYGVADQGWHYGLTLAGDPTLTVTTEEQSGEAPAGVTLTGPRTGVVQMSNTFSATVSPVTATQPLVYVWQATGQVSVTHKSSQSDAATFTWQNTPGIKSITLTVTNFAGSVTGTHAITIESPEVKTTPESLYETLVLGAALTRPLTVSNTGQGRLVFNLAEADHRPPAGSAPDSFGYTYKDSNEVGGPAYEWIEIAPPAGGSGTPVPLPTNWQGGYSWPISLPFTFNFYGVDHTQLAINSHGALNFKDHPIGRNNDPIPSTRVFGMETFIAPFWDFLVVDPGAVYYQALDSMFVIEYYQVSRYGGNHGTWEAILFANGNILFQYQDVHFDYYRGNNGQSATVGIQGDAITGLQYSYNTSFLSDGLAVCFAYPGQFPDCSAYQDVSWLSQNPSTGATMAGGVQATDITFDAGASEVTQPGQYQATLIVVNNDPSENLVAVPVTMTVIPPVYALTLSPLASVRSGNPNVAITHTLQVTNTGNTFDTFDVVASGCAWPTDLPVAIGPLAAGHSANIDVMVHIPSSATGNASDTATISVASRGASTQSVTATLTTIANVVYALTVEPATDAQSGNPGTAVTYTLQVTNTGNTTDTFDVAVGGNTWAVNAPATLGPLAAGGSVNVDVIIEVPTDAVGGATEVITIDVASQGDDAQAATVTLSTTANLVFGVMMHPVADACPGDPGTAVTHTLQVTNTGNTTDTFDVAVGGNTWVISTPTTLGPLPTRAKVNVVIVVNIPSDAVGGIIDTATVTVTSQSDNAQSATATLTTTVQSLAPPSYNLFLPLIVQD
jgi:hypothetical protein